MMNIVNGANLSRLLILIDQIKIPFTVLDEQFGCLNCKFVESF